MVAKKGLFMQLRSIKYFCDVARLGSFTAAAEENFISQSAISQQVRQLERDLGVTLVQKRGRSFELTSAGAHFAAKAPGILEDLERLSGETVDIALGNPTTLRIGYLASYDGWEVAAAIAALKRRHPYAEITALAASHDGLYEELRLRRADLVFNDKRRAFSSEYVNCPIMSCLEYIEVSEASPLAREPQVTAQKLKGITCIIIASEGQQSVEQDYYRNVLNFDCPMTFVRTLQEARMMVAADQGFLHIEARGDKGPAGTVIRRIPLVSGADGSHVSRDYFAFYPTRDANPLAPEFTEILRELF